MVESSNVMDLVNELYSTWKPDSREREVLANHWQPFFEMFGYDKGLEILEMNAVKRSNQGEILEILSADKYGQFSELGISKCYRIVQELLENMNSSSQDRYRVMTVWTLNQGGNFVFNPRVVDKDRYNHPPIKRQSFWYYHMTLLDEDDNVFDPILDKQFLEIPQKEYFEVIFPMYVKTQMFPRMFPMHVQIFNTSQILHSRGIDFDKKKSKELQQLI